jgi:cytidine deaminase
LKQYSFAYEELENDGLLNKKDQLLLAKARAITKEAYAPYSNFFVGAAAQLTNKKIVAAANQENASFPVGICAERVLLSTITSLYGKAPIDAIAISYNRKDGRSNHPISPCGICRQSLAEFEERVHQPIRLILSGMEGKVIIINKASSLLPLNFSSEDIL